MTAQLLLINPLIKSHVAGLLKANCRSIAMGYRTLPEARYEKLAHAALRKEKAFATSSGIAIWHTDSSCGS